MHRILFSVGQYEVSSYSFFTVLALLIVVFGIYFYGQRRGFSRATLRIVIPLLALSAFAGARFLHAAINLELYKNEPWRLWHLGFSGFSIYGGLLGAVICAVICAHIFRFDLWRLGDTAAPFLGLGIASMRVGCYLNGCCFGQETDLPWGVTFPFMSQAHSHQLVGDPGHLFYVSPVHPTQLYELGYVVLGAIVAILIIKWQNKNNLVIASEALPADQQAGKQSHSGPHARIPDGWPILAFGLIYTLGRLINIHFRVQPPTVDAPEWFYPLLYVLALGVMVGLGFWQSKAAKA